MTNPGENDYRDPGLTHSERKVRNFHFWGLLGIIPNIGLIAGIVILVKAFKYNKRSLYLVAIAGILFTPIFWIFVFPSLLSPENLRPLMQMQLNNVVKSIEFYKLENGQYPDSLQQLVTDDNFVPIYEHPGKAIWKQPSLYNYNKVGDKYTLFSSGPDGIANTKDDYYPETKGGDSSKIGLIRRAQ